MSRRLAPSDALSQSLPVRRSIPTKWFLLAVSFALFVVGVLFGEPVAPRSTNQPPFGVSPIVRRTINDARRAPRLPSAASSLPAAKARGELQEVIFESATLGREEPLGIYFPPEYFEDGERRFPVLYALHGLAGYYAEWVDFGASSVADSLFSNNQVPPFIIVFPQGDQSYWFNHPDGEAWGDYVINDVIPLVDASYRTIPDRSSRAIGGLSMGATGALQLGLRRPDLFSVIGAHSPSFRSIPDADNVFWFFDDQAYYAQYDPFNLVRTTTAASQLRIWLDVGEQDDWRKYVQDFHNLLDERGIAHRYSTAAGIHEGSYWGPRMPEYLTFYGYAFIPPVQPLPPVQVDQAPTTND